MNQLIGLRRGHFFLHHPTLQIHPCYSPTSIRLKSLSNADDVVTGKHQAIQFSRPAASSELDHTVKRTMKYQDTFCDGVEPDAFLHVQTLREFPEDEISGKVVMVRFDSTVILQENQENQENRTSSYTSVISTINYLHEAGAKLILVSSWKTKINSKILSAESVAELLTLILKLKVIPVKFEQAYVQTLMEDLEDNILLLENLSVFKDESANSTNFSEQLSSGIDIFVNDSFSLSHKILASTVGICRFCYFNLAGFHFEESLLQLRKATESNRRPYIAIIGGGNFLNKASSLQTLVSTCDGLVFVGNVAFQIMHALGLRVPVKFIEHGANKEAFNIIHMATSRRIPILYPKDFWCMNENLQEQFKIFPAQCIPQGWVPVDLGRSSLDEINSILSKCEKILWIGTVKFSTTNHDNREETEVALMREKLTRKGCDITVIGKTACESIVTTCNTVSHFNMIENASVMWEFLKGRKLHGLMALDRVYPFEIDWDATYKDPAQPLIVDIGSGSGLFLFEMARRRKDVNFLGLEMNKRLVRRCLDSVHHSGTTNLYFVATNATSSFRSIVSSYPGKLVLVTIQCPNPDFKKPEHRWRMLQRSLVEAIADLLAFEGKVFLQSDIEAVAVRMKEEFRKYSKGKLVIWHNDGEFEVGEGGWIKDNPLGVRSDWEQHVLDRGAPMFRLMFYKPLLM